MASHWLKNPGRGSVWPETQPVVSCWYAYEPGRFHDHGIQDQISTVMKRQIARVKASNAGRVSLAILP